MPYVTRPKTACVQARVGNARRSTRRAECGANGARPRRTRGKGFCALRCYTGPRTHHCRRIDFTGSGPATTGCVGAARPREGQTLQHDVNIEATAGLEHLTRAKLIVDLAEQPPFQNRFGQLLDEERHAIVKFFAGCLRNALVESYVGYLQGMNELYLADPAVRWSASYLPGPPHNPRPYSGPTAIRSAR